MATERQCEVVLELFESSFDRVYGFVRRSLDAEAAEEITQEVFSRLLTLNDFESKVLSISYLIKVAENLLKRRHQHRRRWKNVEGELSRSHLALHDARATRVRDDSEGRQVADAMSHLSENEREAVRLTVCEGLSYEDAARSLGVQASTINNWKHRGIQKLKQQVVAGRDR